MRGRVFERYAHMLRQRRRQRALDPAASQEILDYGPAFFVVKRTTSDGAESLIAIHNVTDQPQTLTLQPAVIDGRRCTELSDQITGRKVCPDPEGLCKIRMEPYEFVWLKAE